VKMQGAAGHNHPTAAQIPDDYALQLVQMLQAGVDVVTGNCCGKKRMTGTPRGAYTTACDNNASFSNKEGMTDNGEVGGTTSNTVLSVISGGRIIKYKSNKRDAHGGF